VISSRQAFDVNKHLEAARANLKFAKHYAEVIDDPGLKGLVDARMDQMNLELHDLENIVTRRTTYGCA
jgi:hypothetical protein